MKMRQTLRSTLLPVAILTLGGCIGPFGPVERTIRYDGTVTRADGLPVARVQMEITSGSEVHRPGDPPPREGAPLCSGTLGGAVYRASTDASGRYRVQERRRPPVAGTCLQVRATPPAGSGLAEVFVAGPGNQFTQTSTEDLLHRRIDVVLAVAR